EAPEVSEAPEAPEAPVVPEASYVQSLSAPLDVRIESFETKRSSQYTRYVATKEDISDDEIKEQLSLFEKKDKNEINPDDIHIVGQVFKTYWIMEWNDNMYMIDQHAAHEKVYYERFVKRFNDNEVYSQQLLIPLVLPLNINQANTLREHMELFTKLGFEFSEFGNNEFALHGVPLELCGVDEVEFFIEIIDKMTMYEGRNLSQAEIYKPVCEKIATMACKAAIKGNMAITEDEFKALIVEMFKLENPYNCPHGRPTTISMSKYEIEKKFKRIV
ncbi:MAG TPA: DNA mismatch repair protein MutL, partial [Eubacterium sp.]|nr:DNA mismatch repair protein MutL [Eubacterium sp.]